MKTRKKFYYPLSMLLLMFPLIFMSVSADANITRSCQANYSIYIESPAAIRGSHFDTRDFSGKGGCGAVVPNRCRDRASEKLLACFRAQYSNPGGVPAECTAAHNVHDYPFRVSLERYLQETVCGRYEGHREITVRVSARIRGREKCDCNPWSDRVLDCPASGPIRVTCPTAATTAPGVIDIEPVQMYPVGTQDDTPPTITITSPTSNPTHSTSSTPSTLRGTASDTVGVTRVAWANDRGGSGTCAGTTNWRCTSITLRDGTNNITVTAEDAAGNPATDRIAITYTAGDTTPPGGDETSPTVTITGPTAHPTYSTGRTPIALSGSASDDVGVTRVTWANDQGGGGPCSGTTNWNCTGINIIGGSTNNVTITAEDAAGNSGSDSIAITFGRPGR